VPPGAQATISFTGLQVEDVWRRDPQPHAQPTRRPGARIPHAWLAGIDEAGALLLGPGGVVAGRRAHAADTADDARQRLGRALSSILARPG
jgi:2,4-dichlorophenol 6-monooxygenase